MVKIQNFVESTVCEDTLHQKALQDVDCCNTQICSGALMKQGGMQGGSYSSTQKLTDARDFIDQFYDSLKQKGSPEHHARLEEVERSLGDTGTYTHSLQELEFGAKTAWRNAARCIGRIQWKNLKLLDARHVTTASEMFECMLDHIKYATNGGNIRSAITIFPPLQEVGSEFRVWNSQLIQYAGYKRGDEVIGDPAAAGFTQLLESLGWQGKGGRFDVLPLLLQAPGQDPEWFEIPEELVMEVRLRHPEFPWFEELGLKWYCVPAVANMLFDCGGVEYTAAPFNGWYMGTEVGARDLCDTQRYNILPIVAEKMGLDTNRLSSLWKDKVLLEVNVAVLYSYQTDGVTITDHHTASETFMHHMEMEIEARGGCPADWVWIVPPMSGSACPVFHQEMIKYTLKPSYEYQVAPWAYDSFGVPFIKPKSTPSKPRTHTVAPVPQRSNSNKAKEDKRPSALASPISAMLSVTKEVTKVGPQVKILYATETGRSASYSKQAAKVLQKNGYVPKVMCMADYEVSNLQTETHLLVIASTFGSGDPPQNGQTFWDSLKQIKSPDKLNNLRYSVLALGSSLYPMFCKFGKDVDEALSERGAVRVCEVQEADEMKGQESAYNTWIARVIQALTGEGSKTVNESEIRYRSRFLPDTEPTVSNQILESLHNTKVKLAEVKRVKQLHAKGTTPRYLEVQLSDKYPNGWGVYEPGDHLQVYPGNTRKDVQMVLSKTRVTPEQHTVPLLLEYYDEENKQWRSEDRLPGAVSLYQALSWFMDLMAPVSDVFLDELRKHKISHRKDYEHTPPVYLEVLQQVNPLSVPPELLLQHVPIIRPRKYSLASAPLYEKKEDYAICFKEIVYSRNGAQYKGLTTGFLTGIKPAHRLHCSFIPAPTFRLTVAGSKPILMVAQGTGVAPFRSFWRHKMALRQNNHITGSTIGDLYLYYGCRSPDVDYLHKKEILAMKSKGVLEDVHMAFSRDKATPKTYVQDLFVQHFEQVGQVIHKQQGYVYYCGDIRNWDEVCELLAEALYQYTFSSKQEATKYIHNMIENGRLLKDLFMD